MNEDEPVSASLPDRCPACRFSLQRLDAGSCPECGHDLHPAATLGAVVVPPSFLSLPPMRYQNAYLWLVLVSSLDIMLTYLVIYVFDGYEANPVAADVIERMGFVWAIVFKFALVVLAIVLCEDVGRRDDRLGTHLSKVFIVIGAAPVLYTFVLLFLDQHIPALPGA
jgi:uncharacterized membrane protein